MNKADCSNCGIKSRAVETLNEEELDLLKKNCAEVSLKVGEFIIKEGSLSSHIAYIKTGLAKVHMTGPSGKDQILKIVTPGSYIGVQTILAEKVHKYSASTLEESKICYIDNYSFIELISRNPKFAYELILYLCQDELSYFERFVNQSQKQINGRLADALLYYAAEIKQQDDFRLSLSRSDLAALIGSTRESVTRALKELADVGVIKVDGKNISISNKTLLNTISQKG